MAPLPLDEYHIGVVCALHVELAAVQAMLDEEHGPITDRDANDHNAYVAGRIHQHDIVIACLPAGVDGVSAAAIVANDMVRTFPQLHFGLLVGIGGGVPDVKNGIDIRLGDVVVSQPKGVYGGVVQYDKGKSVRGQRWERKGMLNAPPQILLTAIQSLQARHEFEDSKIALYLTQMLQRWPKMKKSGYAFPGSQKDILHGANSNTPVERDERETFQPSIYYGTIMSGNRVIKDAVERDSLRHEYGALCVEMEAAGLMNNFPCLVVRGICDYADAHKNDEWHRYAAASAAAFAKELLQYVPVQQNPKHKSTRKMLKEIDRSRDEQLLKTITRVGGAAHKSYDNQRHQQCLPGTRVDVLQRIVSWVTQHSAQYIFWLRGRAGTGKSTVALTIAHLLDKQDIPVASFFFKRGGGDLASSRKLISTLAFQLSTQSPEFASFLCESIRIDPDVVTSASLPEQFDQMLVQPLQRFQKHMTRQGYFLIILDALDECDDPDDARLLLKLLGNVENMARLGLRVLITSRPEIPIRLEFYDMDHVAYYDLALHDVPRLTVDHDIELYVSHKLSRIREQRRLPSSWPGLEIIRTIVTRANGLFIYAATICLYVNGPWQISPVRRLEQVCQGSMKKHKSTDALNSMYLTILEQSLDGDFTDDEMKESIDQLREIMGTIVLLFDSLSARAIAGLLYPTMSDGDELIQRTLDPLQAIFAVPEDVRQPIQALHLSFRDFLVDVNHCPDLRFQVNQQSKHHDLAIACLEVMTRYLKQNICQLVSSGTLASEITASALNKFLSDELRYACRHWVDHVESGNVSLSDGSVVFSFLQKHAIYWLEVMSLIGNIPEAIAAASKLELLTKQWGDSTLRLFIHDMYRFMRTFDHMLTEAPLQLYSAGLLLSPTSSIFRKSFITEVHQNIQVKTQQPTHWTACIHVYEHGNDIVKNVAFSSDGTRVVSSTREGTVNTWDVQTGRRLYVMETPSAPTNCQNAVHNDIPWVITHSGEGDLFIWDSQTGSRTKTLAGHSGTIYAVALTNDCARMASGSSDTTVRLWNTRTGECVHVLRGHSAAVGIVVFSSDGRLLLTNSGNEIYAWDVHTGLRLYKLQSRSRGVVVLTFSADDSHAAYGTNSGILGVWCVKTGDYCNQFRNSSPACWIHSVIFSRDGLQVMSGSEDGVIRVWNLGTGQRQKSLRGHTNTVNVMEMSPDGSSVVSGSADGTVRVWNLANGQCKSTFTGHTNRIECCSFSPDGMRLASGSRDGTLRLWDMSSLQYSTIPRSRPRRVVGLFSAPEPSVMVSTLSDGTVEVWDITTGQRRQRLEGHTDCVNDIAFLSDGSRIVSCSSDKTIRLWNIETGECLKVLQGHRDIVRAVRVLPGSAKIISVTNVYLAVWDLKTGQQLNHTWADSAVQYLAISPNGQQVLHYRIGNAGSVSIWDLTTDIDRKLERNTKYPAVFLAQNALAYTNTVVGQTYVQEVNTKRDSPVLEVESMLAAHTSISRDGSKLLCVGTDFKISVWNIANRKCFLQCTVEAESKIELDQIRFSDDSQSIIVGGDLIDIPPDEILLNSTSSPPSYQSLVRSRLNVKDDWICRGSERILWIPREYRPEVQVLLGDILVLGSAHGLVTFVSETHRQSLPKYYNSLHGLEMLRVAELRRECLSALQKFVSNERLYALEMSRVIEPPARSISDSEWSPSEDDIPEEANPKPSWRITDGITEYSPEEYLSLEDLPRGRTLRRES